MQIFRSFFVLCSILISHEVLIAQEKSLEKGDLHYDNLSYFEAILSYESAFSRGAEDVQRMRRLAECYRHIRDMENAVIWYSRIVNNGEATDGDKVRYAEALRANGRYEEADKWLESLKGTVAVSAEVKRFRDSQDHVAALLTEGLFRGKVRPLSSNTETADWSPYVLGSELVFSSSRTKDMTFKGYHGYDGKAYMNLYKGSFTDGGDVPKVVPFSKRLNSVYHESNPTFSGSGDLMAFTRNHLTGRKLERTADGVNNLQIYFSSKKGGKWESPESFEHNNVAWSTGHPSLTEDGDRLFFVSDKPGGYGGSDIYVSKRNADNTWSEPRNLGSRVNTSGNEMTPVVHKDGTLFFASDGHFGVGGLDIFMTMLTGDEPGEVLNLGAPINSRYDELSLVLTSSGTAGYFSSNRTGGAGDDDIYRVDLTKPFDKETFFSNLDDIDSVAVAEPNNVVFKRSEVIDAHVFDTRTGSSLEGVQVLLEGQARLGVAAIKATTDSDGLVLLELPLNVNRSNNLILTKEGYLPRLIYVDNPDENTVVGASHGMDVGMTPLAKGLDIAAAIGLSPIYFDFESWEILPEAAQELERIAFVLRTHPSVEVEIGSHTDSKGSNGFNDVLSDMRASATRDYLIDLGIDSARISYRGYGESKLVNECADGVDCTEEQHKQNRRTEFIVQVTEE
jgi:outer membrane protein OmpA-like peptidoglycan-associated protein/Tol biopolymer transport system component